MKAKRQALIREIVEAQSIQTQEELAEALRMHGMMVTQATVSRELREMHQLKVLAEDGSYRYATMERNETGVGDRLIRMLADSVVEMNSANNLIVVRTLPGSAHVAAEAIDNLRWAEIMLYKRLDNGKLQWPKDENEVRNLSQQQFRWLLEGLSLQQPKAIAKSSKGVF